MRRRRYTNSNPMIITAKFDSECPETGKLIKKGDQAVYYPSSKKAYHMDSEQAGEFRSGKLAAAWNMVDKNW